MDALVALYKLPALGALGTLVQSGPLFELPPGAKSADAWRGSPRVGVLGTAGFALVREAGAPGAPAAAATIVFRASALDALRAADLLGDARAAAAAAFNAFELSAGAPPAADARASPPPPPPARVAVVAPDADAKAAWLAALLGALCDAAPPDVQLDRGWAHGLVRGTLHAAAAEGDAAAVRALLRFSDAALAAAPLPPSADAPPPLDASAHDTDGATPLHLAASRAHVDALAALLEGGADVFATDADGDTPLHAALAAGAADAALALTVNGAPQGARSLLGATPLAALLCAPALLDARDEKDEPARELRGVAEALLAHGAPPREADGEGFTPAHRVAMLHGSSALVKALARKGADWTARALVCRPDGADVRDRGGGALLRASPLTALATFRPLLAGFLDAAPHCVRRALSRGPSRRARV